MITDHDYLGYQISVECGQHRLSSIASAWMASFEYTHNGVLVHERVQACARQKTAQAARDKALRFAIDLDRCPRRLHARAPIAAITS